MKGGMCTFYGFTCIALFIRILICFIVPFHWYITFLNHNNEWIPVTKEHLIVVKAIDNSYSL
jgi:hypothetical protein